MEAPKLIIMVGFPGCGKSTYARTLAGHAQTRVLSRDLTGKTIVALLPETEKLLDQGYSVILDNTNLTRETRAPFIQAASVRGLEVTVVYFKDCTIENSLINVLRRMYERYGRVFMTSKEMPKNDPGCLPAVVLFNARKTLEAPSLAEGIDAIKIVPSYKETWASKAGKALFLDIDGTVRATEHLEYKYPTRPEEVALIRPAAELRAVLDRYVAEGYKIIGISNQSGIAKGTLTAEQADACFDKTRELLGIDFPIHYCPHNPAPITCYCRKPQSGLFIQAAETYDINLTNSIMVGDQKTDETAATRLGMRFIHAEKFFD